MPIRKSCLFGACNPSPWDTKSRLEFKPLAQDSDELKRLFQSPQYRYLARALHREGLKPSLPEELVIEALAEKNVSIDEAGEWRKQLPGRISGEKLEALKPTRHWSYKEGPLAEQTFEIKNRSFKRFAFTASSKSDKTFHVLLVEHYAPNVEKKLVGNLLFVIMPELELFK